MIGLLQRVSSARGAADGAAIAEIGQGLRVLIGARRVTLTNDRPVRFRLQVAPGIGVPENCG